MVSLLPSTAIAMCFSAAAVLRSSAASCESVSRSTVSRGISSPSSSWDRRMMSPISVTRRCASFRMWPTKRGDVLLLHHAVFQQLRAADDALQRRFELVRHVRREFTARLLRCLALGDVESQQHSADRRAACADAADVKLPDTAAALHARLTVPLVHGALDGKAHVVAAVDGQKVLPTQLSSVPKSFSAAGLILSTCSFFHRAAQALRACCL